MVRPIRGSRSLIQTLTILFTACHVLGAGPDLQCQDVELRGQGTVQSCLLGAQPAVAQWIEMHRPGWRVRGPITCTTGERA